MDWSFSLVFTFQALWTFDVILPGFLQHWIIWTATFPWNLSPFHPCQVLGMGSLQHGICSTGGSWMAQFCPCPLHSCLQHEAWCEMSWNPLLENMEWYQGVELWRHGSEVRDLLATVQLETYHKFAIDTERNLSSSWGLPSSFGQRSIQLGRWCRKSFLRIYMHWLRWQEIASLHCRKVSKNTHWH